MTKKAGDVHMSENTHDTATQEESQYFLHLFQMFVTRPPTEACTVNHLLTHLDLDNDSRTIFA